MTVVLNSIDRHFEVKVGRLKRDYDHCENEGASTYGYSNWGSLTNTGNGDGSDNKDIDLENATNAGRSSERNGSSVMLDLTGTNKSSQFLEQTLSYLTHHR